MRDASVSDLQTYSNKDYLKLFFCLLYFTHQSRSAGTCVIRDLSVSIFWITSLCTQTYPRPSIRTLWQAVFTMTRLISSARHDWELGFSSEEADGMLFGCQVNIANLAFSLLVMWMNADWTWRWVRNRDQRFTIWKHELKILLSNFICSIGSVCIWSLNTNQAW